MWQAAQLMVQNLAGSLALVTCKEPLRVACGGHLRTLLQQAGVDVQLTEQAVQVCSQDNLVTALPPPDSLITRLQSRLSKKHRFFDRC